MSSEWTLFSGMALMLVLGLRHGLDADHIACIDGLTWQALGRESQRHQAVWIGTLFALGHGLLVTLIAAGVSLLSHAVTVPKSVGLVFDWIPTTLLVLVGTMNLRLLMRRDGSFTPIGWKLGLIPARVRLHGSPWSVVLIGVLFATVFDTASQALAWGFVASHRGGGLPVAIGAGLVFTVGMVVTDSLDGRIICSIDRRADGQAIALRYRRVLGWLIVCISYLVAGYNVGTALMPSIELSGTEFSSIGFALMLTMAMVWAWSGRRSERHPQRQPPAIGSAGGDGGNR
jgi:high-affinity nickel-transport protein